MNDAAVIQVPEQRIAKREAPATIQVGSDSMLAKIFEIASNPSIDAQKAIAFIDKFQEIQREQAKLRAQEEARASERAFYAAMASAQQEMGPVSADAHNPQTRSDYASYAQLDRALRPIYTKHGFGITFKEEDSPKPEHVRMVAHVMHTAGHCELYHRDIDASGKGAKGGDVMTKTHASGAAQSYAMRYLLRGIFNVSIGEDDDDGNLGGSAAQREANQPAGYAQWAADMQAVAANGTEALRDAWSKSPPAFRVFASADGNWWANQKAHAARVLR